LDEVKSSYRELAKVWHPDRFGHDPSLLRKSQEKMKQLNSRVPTPLRILDAAK
jgi:curved DNA-binding protein CbpA